MQFDVLIIGAGPAGLMAAAWMARTGIRTLVVERKSRPTDSGHADGLESRTIEILDSFGLGQKIWEESNHTIDICLWNQCTDGFLRRQSISANSKPGWSRYQESTLGQSRIETLLLELVQQSPHVQIRRETMPVSLDIDERALENHNAYSYPLRVKLVPVGDTTNGESALQSNGDADVIKAKYLLGCDGAHSWVRKQLGLKLEGASRDVNWGVLDAFPTKWTADIRRRCIIKSKFGNLMIIPRERKLIRMYVQVPSELANNYWVNYGDPEVIMKAVRKIMRPYRFNASRIEWSTIYAVGHRYCKELSRYDRIFLAGDAIHTHSPKAGQGMNVSMQDTYNLGWKLASVIQGVARPNLLRTYHQERLPVAKRLIDFDKRICRGMIEAENTFDDDHKNALVEENTSMSGLAVTYEPNMVIAQPTLGQKLQPITMNGHSRPPHPDPVKAIKLGARIPSELVLSQADSQPHQLQQIFPSTGEWNLVVFGGNIMDGIQKRRVENLATALSSPKYVIQRIKNRRHSNNGTCLVGALSVYLVHSASCTEVNIWDLPEIFRPPDEDTGIDYGKVFADSESYHVGGGKAYYNYGVSSQGCIVLLRPDQHVAFIGGLGDTGDLERFLESVNEGVLQ